MHPSDVDAEIRNSMIPIQVMQYMIRIFIKYDEQIVPQNFYRKFGRRSAQMNQPFVTTDRFKLSGCCCRLQHINVWIPFGATTASDVHNERSLGGCLAFRNMCFHQFYWKISFCNGNCYTVCAFPHPIYKVKHRRCG